MTRPTDASIARALWEEMEEAIEVHFTPTLHEFLSRVKRRAEVLEFDAESPAGTERGSEEVMQNEIRRPAEQHAIPVARGEEGKTSPLTGRQVIAELDRLSDAAQAAYFTKRTCTRPACRAEMRPGLRCNNPHCGLA